MALNLTKFTMLDVLKQSDPSGKLLVTAEVLSQVNPIIQDMVWQQSNTSTSHICQMRSSLPTATWERINKGVGLTKSTTEQMEATMGTIAMLSEFHDLLDAVTPNLAEMRYNNSVAHIEAMGQTFATTFFYGSEHTTPGSFTGMAGRFASTTGKFGSQLVLGGAAGGQSDCASIWIIDHGVDTVYGIHPPGMPAGLQHEDMGKLRVTDSDGNPYFAWCDRFRWTCGVAVQNYKHVVRIANIDTSDLTDAGESGYAGANLISLIIKGLHKMDPQGGRTRVMYANQTVLTALDLLACNKSNVQLSMMSFAGQEVLSVRGVPIRRCDSLTSTESALS